MTEIPQPSPPAPSGEAKTKSKGEKLFDGAVYVGLAGVGTFVATVPMAFLFKHYKPMEPHFHKAVDWLHRQLNRTPFKVSHGVADKVLTTTALMQGGNLMLLPIGVAEHYKVPIVEGLNTALGDKTPPESIEAAPKQTWGSLIESRVLGWLAVFAAFAAIGKLYGGTLARFEEETGELLCKITGKPTTHMVHTLEHGLQEQPTKTYIFGKLGALDVFATIGSATLLYVGGHFFARKQEEHKAQQQRHLAHVSPEGQEEIPAGEIATAAPTLSASRIVGGKTHEGTVQAGAVAQQLG